MAQNLGVDGGFQTCFEEPYSTRFALYPQSWYNLEADGYKDLAATAQRGAQPRRGAGAKAEIGLYGSPSGARMGFSVCPLEATPRMPIDPTSFIPDSIKQRLFGALIDFLVDQAERVVSGQIASALKKLRSDADFQDAFDQALSQHRRSAV